MATTSKPGHEPPTRSARSQLTSGLLFIAQISGLISVVIGTIYVLGLFAVLLPILNTYDVSFDSAWYMVSLVPTNVIAGQGVKSLVWPSLFTVIPIAFIVTLILMLIRLLSVGVRGAKLHTNLVDKSGSLRGVPLITTIYLVYSGVLGVVLLALHTLVEVPVGFLQFHIISGALAYVLFSLLCLLALSLLAWQGSRKAVGIIRSGKVSLQLFKELGSLKVSLHVALCIGMVCVVFSSVYMVRLFSRDEFTAEPVFSAWVFTFLSLIVLGPLILVFLLLDKVFSSDFLEQLGTRLATVAAALKTFLSMVGVGAALASIVLTFVALGVVPSSSSLLFEAMAEGVFGALVLLLSLFIMLMVLLPLSKAIPLGALDGSGAALRFVFIAATMAGMTLLFWGFLTAPMLLRIAIVVLMILGAIMVLLLVVQGVRYTAGTVTKTGTPASTLSNASRRHFTEGVDYFRTRKGQLQRNVGLLAVVRFAGVLFGAFYVTLLIAFMYGKYLIWPLIDNVNSISRSESTLDALYIYSIVAGGILSGALLYKGLLHSKEVPSEDDLSSAEEGPNLRDLFWKTTRRPTWTWIAWALTGAYAFSVIVGSLIAYLEEPPLPQVQVVRDGNVIEPEATASIEEPGFHASTQSLLAHAEGYWYLLNEDDGNLVVIPDQSNNIIRMPRYIDTIDERRSIKVEVPSEWGEHLSDYPYAWREDPTFEPKQSSRLMVSTNVDNWGRDNVTPGTFVEVYSPEQWSKVWDDPVNDSTVTEAIIYEKVVQEDFCGSPDEGPAVYDLEDEERRYTAKVIRWRSCERGGYFASLVAVPKDHSFVLYAQVQLPSDQGTAYDAETNRIWRSIEVKSGLLP